MSLCEEARHKLNLWFHNVNLFGLAPQLLESFIQTLVMVDMLVVLVRTWPMANGLHT